MRRDKFGGDNQAGKRRADDTMYTETFTRSTCTPDRAAARSLPPTAYTYRPKGVRAPT